VAQKVQIIIFGANKAARQRSVGPLELSTRLN